MSLVVPETSLLILLLVSLVVPELLTPVVSLEVPDLLTLVSLLIPPDLLRPYTTAFNVAVRSRMCLLCNNSLASFCS